jgi:hypothetical protein
MWMMEDWKVSDTARPRVEWTDGTDLDQGHAGRKWIFRWAVPRGWTGQRCGSSSLSRLGGTESTSGVIADGAGSLLSPFSSGSFQPNPTPSCCSSVVKRSFCYKLLICTSSMLRRTYATPSNLEDPTAIR